MKPLPSPAPCPWCEDSRPELRGSRDDSWVQCTMCCARGPVKPDEGRAIATWNRVAAKVK